MKTLALALIASLVAGTAFSTPRQFDLVCTGTITNDAGAKAPWSNRVSVDLDAAAYCYERPCVSPLPIARVEPGVVFLSDRPTTFLVNRVTGEFSRNLVEGRAEGTCAVAEFTPFPKPMF